MSWEAANEQRARLKRGGMHYKPTRAHGTDYVRPSRAKKCPRERMDKIIESIERGFRRVARAYKWDRIGFNHY